MAERIITKIANISSPSFSYIQKEIIKALTGTSLGHGIPRLNIRILIKVNREIKSGHPEKLPARTTVYDNLKKLEKREYVGRTDTKIGHSRGRPNAYWFLTRKGRMIENM